jgi:hypothetical protein
LELKSGEASNDLYRWDWYTDEEELQDWIPWWAPRCVIGHLYIPFRCGRLELPPHGVTEIEKACGGKVRWGWVGDYEKLLTPFISPEWIRPHVLHHRLPLWLIVLPLPNRLVPCLYAAIYRPIGFKPKEHFPSYDDPVLPCFVDRLGKQIEDDEVYFEATYGLDDYTTLYVSASEAGIFVIGSGVEDMWNFKSELMCSDIDDLPEWLQPHPVQRLLKLTMDSDEAKQFSLSPRSFAHTHEWSPRDDESASREELTVFRAAFPDPVGQCTPLRQNTIAAYLLRSFTVKDKSFFDALREDALARAAPARELVDRELSKFLTAFDERFGK